MTFEETLASFPLEPSVPFVFGLPGGVSTVSSFSNRSVALSDWVRSQYSLLRHGKETFELNADLVYNNGFGETDSFSYCYFWLTAWETTDQGDILRDGLFQCSDFPAMVRRLSKREVTP